MLKQIRVLYRMRKYRSTKYDRIIRRDFVEDERFANNAGNFVRVFVNESVVVHSIRHVKPIKTGTEVLENACLSSHSRFAANDSAS